MKSLAEHMAFYSSYHRDPRNRLTHFFGVPMIIYAVLIAMSYGRIPVGGLEVSAAAIFLAVMLLYYLTLDWGLGFAMAAVFVPMCWAAQATRGVGRR
ncbi:MAG: Mpo1-like protein [Aliidongia sp.]